MPLGATIFVPHTANQMGATGSCQTSIVNFRSAAILTISQFFIVPLRAPCNFKFQSLQIELNFLSLSGLLQITTGFKSIFDFSCVTFSMIFLRYFAFISASLELFLCYSALSNTFWSYVRIYIYSEKVLKSEKRKQSM